MSELDALSHEEKVLLAGCIRSTIVADGNIDDQELEDLDRIETRLDFQDYEACLEESEERLPDEDALLRAAEGVTNTAAQDLVLRVVHELSLQNGIPTDARESLFRKLSEIWRRR